MSLSDRGWRKLAMELSELTKSRSVWDEDQFALYLGTLQHLVRFDHIIQGDSCSDYGLQPARREQVDQRCKVLAKPVGMLLVHCANVIERGVFAQWRQQPKRHSDVLPDHIQSDVGAPVRGLVEAVPNHGPTPANCSLGLLKVGRSDRVESGIYTGAIGQLEGAAHEVLSLVIDRRSAEAHYQAVFGLGRGAEDLQTVDTTQLQERCPDPASRAVYEDSCTARHSRDPTQHLDCGHVAEHQAGGLRWVDLFMNRHECVGIEDEVLGVAAIEGQCCDSLPGGRSRSLGAKYVNDTDNRVARSEGWSWTAWIAAAANIHVREGDVGCQYFDSGLPWSRRGKVLFDNMEDFGPSIVFDDHTSVFH